MSLAELERMEADTVSVKDVAEVLGCAPYRLRDSLDIDDERPVEMRRFLFPHCKVGNHRVISREGFIRWFREGQMGGDGRCLTHTSQGA